MHGKMLALEWKRGKGDNGEAVKAELLLRQNVVQGNTRCRLVGLDASVKVVSKALD